MVLRKVKSYSQTCSVDWFHKLNHRPSQGTELKKVRVVQTSSLLVISLNQILSWDLPGVPGEEMRAVPEPFP